LFLDYFLKHLLLLQLRLLLILDLLVLIILFLLEKMFCNLRLRHHLVFLNLELFLVFHHHLLLLNNLLQEDRILVMCKFLML
jgi:hypothetical protein